MYIYHVSCTIQYVLRWKCFILQLVNHGVTSSLVEKLKEETEEFFNLPMEEKKKYWQNEGEMEGFGQAFVVCEEQKLDWADIFFLTSLPIHLRKPHLFPKLPLPFRFSLSIYQFICGVFSIDLLIYFAVSKLIGLRYNHSERDNFMFIII